MKSIVYDSTLKECVNTFYKMNSTADEMKKEGEKMFLHLFRTNLTHDSLRYTQLMQSLKMNSSKLESLIPTLSSAV